MSLSQQKTILIPLPHGMQARNLLHTDFIHVLIENNVKVVLLVPEYKISYYKSFLNNENIIIDKLEDVRETFVIKKLKNIAMDLLDTDVVRWWLEGRWAEKKKNIKYIRERITIKLGAYKFLRDLVRWIFSKTVDFDNFNYYFTKYEFDAVVLPDIYNFIDVYLFYAARYANVPCISMIRSWDNIPSRGTCLIDPSNLIVHSEIIKQDAIDILGMHSDNVYVSGMPHYDYYHNYEPSVTREKFLNNLGIPASSKFLLFCEASGSYKPITNEILEILDTSIKNGALPNDLYIVFRYGPSHTSKKKMFYTSDRIIIDRPGMRFERGTKGDWEFSREDMIYMADSMKHASVVLNFCSTMTLDAAALDRPIINLAFDGHTPKDTAYSLRIDRPHNIYVEYFMKAVRAGGTILVKSPKEMIDTINRYIKDESIDREGRKRMVSEQCYKNDGKSGQRAAHYILNRLKSL